MSEVPAIQAVGPLLRDSNLPSMDSSRDPEFFNQQVERLLQFRDKVLAGQHPSIKPPPKMSLAASNTDAATEVQDSSSSRSVIAFSRNASSQSAKQPNQQSPSGNAQTPPVNMATLDPGLKVTSAVGVVSNGVNRQNKKEDAASDNDKTGFDPALLQKSDQLVKAEMRMRRFKLELALQEQTAADPKSNAKKAHHNHQHTDIDLADVLKRALTIAGIEPTDPDAATSATVVDVSGKADMTVTAAKGGGNAATTAAASAAAVATASTSAHAAPPALDSPAVTAFKAATTSAHNPPQAVLATDDAAAYVSVATSDPFSDNTFYSSQCDTPESHLLSRLPDGSGEEDGELREGSPYEPMLDMEPAAVAFTSSAATKQSFSAKAALPGPATVTVPASTAKPPLALASGRLAPSAPSAKPAPRVLQLPPVPAGPYMPFMPPPPPGATLPMPVPTSEDLKAIADSLKMTPQELARLDLSSLAANKAFIPLPLVGLPPGQVQPARTTAAQSETVGSRVSVAASRSSDPELDGGRQPRKQNPAGGVSGQSSAKSRAAASAQTIATDKDLISTSSPETSSASRGKQPVRRPKIKRKKARAAKLAEQAERAAAAVAPVLPALSIKEEPRSPSPATAMPNARPTKRQRLAQPPRDYDERRYQDAINIDDDYSDSFDRGGRRKKSGIVDFPRREIVHESTHYPSAVAPSDGYGLPESGSDRIRGPAQPAARVYLERPYPETALYYREPLDAGRRGVRPVAARERSRSPRSRSPRSQPPMYERQGSIFASSRMPPPTRILVDEYGREFIESQPRTIQYVREVVPQAPPYRDLSLDWSSSERLRTVAGADGRAVDPYLLPASPTYAAAPRRVFTDPEHALLEHRVYRERDYSLRPMGPMPPPLAARHDLGDLPQGYATRAASVLSGHEIQNRSFMGEYSHPAPEDRRREYVPVRAASVRPPTDGIRYEIPVGYERRVAHVGGESYTEFIPARAASVRPMEVDRYSEVQRPREYGPGYESSRPDVVEQGYPRFDDRGVAALPSDVRRPPETEYQEVSQADDGYIYEGQPPRDYY